MDSGERGKGCWSTWGELKQVLDGVLPNEARLSIVELRPCDMPDRLYVTFDDMDRTYEITDGGPLSDEDDDAGPYHTVAVIDLEIVPDDQRPPSNTH